MTVAHPKPAEVAAATRLLREVGVLHTPLVPFSPRGVAGLWIKPEIHQPAGCFKVRGVFHAVAQRLKQIPEDSLRYGVSTVSAGNTAKALAWSARRFGVPARSVMPASAPRSKIASMRALGGEPILVPTPEVFRYLKERGHEQEPHAFIHPWTDRDVMIGHGTMVPEILVDLADVETVFVPVGGGGLLGGVGGALRSYAPHVRVIAVEPEGCPSLYEALKAGRPVDVDCQTLCDGVAVPYVTDEMFPLLAELADRVVLVSEADVRATIRLLAKEAHIVAEGSAALSVAAALAMPVEERGKSVALVTGGSIDMDVFCRILSEDL